MSGHHYTAILAIATAEWIPLVLLLQIIGSATAVRCRRRTRPVRFPVSGEINHDGGRSAIGHAIHRLHYLQPVACVTIGDGLSIDFVDWRFNYAPPTEPLLRLNVENPRGYGTVGAQNR
ncbi:hypothetical protein [Enterobacter sp. RHBSTW-01064]|uniref:hypothetical protein n=1 Tax=Enterobacter sp. RHBSTW-01064 TaxID=2742679 RepID=UPI0020177562|nr:hypothetical protein [Enterobacter sp. RHBSTW-01064]